MKDRVIPIFSSLFRIFRLHFVGITYLAEICSKSSFHGSGYKINTRVRYKIHANSCNCLDSSICTDSASGLFSKKQYAANAEHRFMMKLCTDLCLECTRFALFLSSSLMHSMMYLFLSMILSHIGMSLFFILAFNPCTRCIPLSKRCPKSSCLMYPLSANTFP